MTAPHPVWYIDLGMMDFSRAHCLQIEMVDARISGDLDRDVVLVLEHPPVFTVGRRGNLDHLKVSPAFLKDAGMEILHIERGGDITFHGPGQLVIYPIFQLSQAGFGVVDFVEKLEDLMIRTAADMGVSAARNRRNHGIWVGDRKMGFVGIAVRRRVSFHGIALNVALSLEPFKWIDPCGLQNVQVTSLERETRGIVSVETVKASVPHHLENIFSITLQSITIEKLKDQINRYETKKTVLASAAAPHGSRL